MNLTKSSKLAKQPLGFCVDLKKHQLAMLQKAEEIEKKSKHGFLTDKAGVGKTAIILGLILRDKENDIPPQTVVIVPQNIHTQWVSEITKMTNDLITVHSVIDYNTVSSLLFDDSVLDSELILTTSAFYDTIFNCIKQRNKAIRRLVYDEIDSMKDIFKSQKVKNDNKDKTGVIPAEYYSGTGAPEKTWFISASIDNIINDSEVITIGEHLIPKEEFKANSVHCDPQFVKESMDLLEDPQIIDIKCVSAIEKFTDFLSIEQLDALNSLNFKKVLGAKTEKEIILFIVKNYLESVSKCTTNVVPKQKVVENKKLLPDINRALEKEITNLLKEKKFFESVLALIFEKNNLNFDPESQESYKDFTEALEKYDSVTVTKISSLEKITKELSTNNKKALFFSDYEGSFDLAKKILDKYKVKNEELQGGNPSAISKSIQNYKCCDTRVLLLDSENNSRGMNLENTDLIVFLHKTKEFMYNQIVGRARRPGRTSKLQIITLLNTNECIE